MTEPMPPDIPQCRKARGRTPEVATMPISFVVIADPQPMISESDEGGHQ